MTDHDAATGHPSGEILRTVREEVNRLVKTVPGPVASISLRMADCAVNITWAQPAAPAELFATPPVQLPVVDPSQQSGAPDDLATAVVAPIVGTFYRAPEPGASPFVEVGQRVELGQTIGIVEAMKLMNPVPAPQGGRVLGIEVGDAEPVEFGQVLVRIGVDEP